MSMGPSISSWVKRTSRIPISPSWSAALRNSAWPCSTGCARSTARTSGTSSWLMARRWASVARAGIELGPQSATWTLSGNSS